MKQRQGETLGMQKPMSFTWKCAIGIGRNVYRVHVILPETTFLTSHTESGWKVTQKVKTLKYKTKEVGCLKITCGCFNTTGYPKKKYSDGSERYLAIMEKRILSTCGESQTQERLPSYDCLMHSTMSGRLEELVLKTLTPTFGCKRSCAGSNLQGETGKL